jgi:hypothetical protein
VHRLDGERAALAKQALPLNWSNGSVLRVKLRQMLRWFANGGASEVASRVANRVASSGDNIVAHSRCVRVNRPIFRQTSSLSTA